MSDHVQQKRINGWAIAALICGLVSLLVTNPLYLVSLAAIILGIVGLTRASGKGMAVAGIITGGVAVVCGILWDIIMLPITFGLGFFF